MSFRWLSLFIIVMLATSVMLAQAPEETPATVALHLRRTDSENRALFQSAEPLQFTLEANFGVVTKDRNPESTKEYPGMVKIADGGRMIEIPVQLSARGHLRRRTCEFIPLRVAFPKSETKGTVFEMPGSALKLVTHCISTNVYEQYILKEYLAYRIANILTPRSFRARLSRVTYVDSVKRKTLTTRYAMFLEDDDDVARRLEGKITERRSILFNQLHPVALLQMMLFEFMIGNTDYSISAQHNVRIVDTPVGLIYPIPYDFDVSGFVNTPYGAPDPVLRLQNLSQRLYRGPCRTPEQLAPMLNIFRIKKTEILAAVESLADLNKTSRSELKNYLNGFFSLIDKPSSVKSYLIDPCLKGGI